MRAPAKRILLFAAVLAAAAASAQTVPDALKEYRAGNFEEAVRICTAEIAANPQNLESHVVLSWSLVKLGRYDAAAETASSARNLNRYDPRAIEILAEARYYQGRNAESLSLFKEYVMLAPEGGRIDQAYYLMGEIFLRTAKFRHADMALTTAVRYVPGNATWWLRLGYARERAGETRFAVEAYEKALSLDPRSNDAKRALGRLGASTAPR